MLSITNMYVNRLIVLAIDPDVEVREIGIDVLTSIHGQGAVNPTVIIPTLFSLQSCCSSYVRENSFKIMSKIYEKNSDIFLINLTNTFKIVYDFQKSIYCDEVVVTSTSGFPIFGNIYRLFCDKKHLRNKFLNNLIRITEGMQDSDYSFFICYVLSSLPYTHCDELTEIINFMNITLSTTAHQSQLVLNSCTKSG